MFLSGHHVFLVTIHDFWKAAEVGEAVRCSTIWLVDGSKALKVSKYSFGIDCDQLSSLQSCRANNFKNEVWKLEIPRGVLCQHVSVDILLVLVIHYLGLESNLRRLDDLGRLNDLLLSKGSQRGLSFFNDNVLTVVQTQSILNFVTGVIVLENSLAVIMECEIRVAFHLVLIALEYLFLILLGILVFVYHVLRILFIGVNSVE